MVERAGFEPAKAEPEDLQSSPVGHLGTSPEPTNYREMELVMGLEPATC